MYMIEVANWAATNSGHDRGDNAIRYLGLLVGWTSWYTDLPAYRLMEHCRRCRGQSVMKLGTSDRIMLLDRPIICKVLLLRLTPQRIGAFCAKGYRC